MARDFEQMKRTRQENLAKRLAAAPKPGAATTIDGVLDRTNGPIFLARQQALEALIGLGGVAEDSSGLATAILHQAMKDEGYAGESTAVAGLLLSMEKDKQVRRVSRGKRTFKIGLLDPIDGVDIEAVNLAFDADITLDAAKTRLRPVEPEPVVEPTPAPVAAPPSVAAPTPPPAPAPAVTPRQNIPAVSSLSSDDDLWDLLEIVLDGPVMMTRDTLSAVTRWMDATRDLLKIKEAG